MLSISQLFLILAPFIIQFLISIAISGFQVRGVSWSPEATKWHHNLRSFENDILHNFASSTSDYDDFNKTLDAILVPRVPGTEGHKQVQNYIKSSMLKLGWSVEEDSFNGRTPHGQKPFNNIVATLDPKACRFLTLACHYDSLYNREYTFLGATDSAVPCTMMLHAVRMLHEPLKERKRDDVSLQLIFFDGEEAFKKWSRTDSLYGSRHLAAKWNRTPAFPSGEGRHCHDRDYVSYLDRIDVFMLLDLIGTANPTFYSYFPETYALYSQIADTEKRLNSLQLLESQPPESRTRYFISRSTFNFVEDDHVPFMNRGVPILHIIPSPFPHVWHKESDNRNSLHHPTIDNLNKILRTFIAQYLHLDI